MTTETTEQDLQAAFDSGFNDTQPEPSAPAADAAAPVGPAADEPAPDAQAGGQTEDELAGLPPKVRAMLDEFQTMKQAVAAFPGLEQRLRKTEGRIGDLNTRLPAPTPPAPPRLEKVERVRAELPEVIEALEEYVQSREAKPQAPETPASAAKDDTPVLSAAAPDWETKVGSPEFSQWLDKQPADYQQRIKTTNSEAVMLQAITRFDTTQEFQRQAAEQAAANAQRVAQTRHSRAAAAAVPNGAGRRAPTSTRTAEDEFMAGFNSP